MRGKEGMVSTQIFLAEYPRVVWTSELMLGLQEIDLSSRFSWILSSIGLLDAEVAPEWFWWGTNVVPTHIWFLNRISQNVEKVSLQWASCRVGNFMEQNKKLYILLPFAFSCLDLFMWTFSMQGLLTPCPSIAFKRKNASTKQGEMYETYPYEEKYINSPQLG